MIDRDTAIQWAKDAGCHVMQLVIDADGNRAAPTIIASAEQIQSLITRAQNEAFERAAKMEDVKADDYAKEFGFDDMGALEFSREAQREYHSTLIEFAEEIRALKQEADK